MIVVYTDNGEHQFRDAALATAASRWPGEKTRIISPQRYVRAERECGVRAVIVRARFPHIIADYSGDGVEVVVPDLPVQAVTEIRFVEPPSAEAAAPAASLPEVETPPVAAPRRRRANGRNARR